MLLSERREREREREREEEREKKREEKKERKKERKKEERKKKDDDLYSRVLRWEVRSLELRSCTCTEWSCCLHEFVSENCLSLSYYFRLYTLFL